MGSSMSWLPENNEFEYCVCVSFLGIFAKLLHDILIPVCIMISLQCNITQNLEQFKICNTFLSMWLLVGFILPFVFMYLFCLYQSVGMCIWWTSSLGYVEDFQI